MKESLHPEVQFSLEAGLVNPRDIRERMQGIVTYKAQDQRTGEPVFVKQALVPEAKKHIVREVAAQHLLYERSLRNPDGAGFAFLYPELRNSSLILPDLEQSEGKWLAQERGDKFVSDAYEKYGDAMQRFFVACRAITWSELPDVLQQDAEERAMLAQERFFTDARYLVDQRMLLSQDVDRLWRSVEYAIGQRHFAHHDVVPWHMYAQDNRVTLVDAGWATWSFPEYDLVYYSLQMIGYAHNKADALRAWSEAHTHKTIADPRAVAGTMAFRGVRLTAEMGRNHRQGAGAIALLAQRGTLF